MKEWQRKAVNKNLSTLIKNTECNTGLMVKLEEAGILTADEISQLNCLNDKNPSQQVEKLYRLLVQRDGAFEGMQEALRETKQSKALKILTAVVPIDLNGKSVLGRGMYGSIVYEEKWEEKVVAVKQAFNSCFGKSYESEISILKSCKNENILKCYDSDVTENYSLIYLELCDKTLKEWVTEVRRKNDKNVDPLDVVRQITLGLDYLHKRGIVHKDLHPENILIKNQPALVKIADFDRSGYIEDGTEYVSTSEIYGSRGWIAPEILEKLLLEGSNEAHFTCASDIFALGCIYYFVLTDGKNLFGDPLRRSVNIVEERAMLDYKSVVHGCSQNLLFIKFMVAHNPQIRPSCSNLLLCPMFWDDVQCITFVKCSAQDNEMMIDSTSDSGADLQCNYDHSVLLAYLRKAGRKTSKKSKCFIPLEYLQKQECGGELQKYFSDTGGFNLTYLKTATNAECRKNDASINGQNKSDVSKVTSDLQDVLNECQLSYVENFRLNSKSCSSVKDMFIAHNLAMKIPQNKFKKWINNNAGFSKISLTPLHDMLNNEYTNLLEKFFQRKYSEAERNGLVKLELRKYYHTVMSNHFEENDSIFHPTVLRTLHDRASESALEFGMKKVTENSQHLKDLQLQSLQADLEKCFKKYKNLNYKNANGTVDADAAVGIDLGDTYCCVAILYRGNRAVVRYSDGGTTTPTYLTLNEKREPIFGTVAKDKALENPKNAVYHVMRLIREIDSKKPQNNDKNNWPFTIAYDVTTGSIIKIFEQQYTPQEVIALMIKSLISQVEKTFGINVNHAVVAVPIYLGLPHTNAIKSACKKASIESSCIDVPTAVTLAYIQETWYDESRRIFIFSFGGSSLDVSIVEVDGFDIDVINTESDTDLGGYVFDKALCKCCIEKFECEYKMNPMDDKEYEKTTKYLRLLNICEKAKIDLSISMKTQIHMNDFYNGKDLRVSVTREEFENIISSHLESCTKLIDKSLQIAGMQKAEIHDIILIGGSVYIPKVQQLVAEYFSQQAVHIKMHPDESIAIGAAIKAALLRGEQVINSPSLGAIQYETPISIGIEIQKHGCRGHFEVIIPKLSKIPTKQTLVCKTYRNNQEEIVIPIYKGEASLITRNKLVGKIILKGIPPKPAGKELIDITIEINAMDIVFIKAVCRSTGFEKELIINECIPGTDARRLSSSSIDDEDFSLYLLTVSHCKACKNEDLNAVPQLMNEAQALLQKEIENYKSLLETRSDEISTIVELENIHSKESHIVLENFKLINPFASDSKNFQQLNCTLQHQLTQVFYTVSRGEIGKSQKLKEGLVKFSEQYGCQMNEAKEEETVVEREELQKIHQTCLKEIMSAFLEEMGTQISEESIKQLERAIRVQFVLINFVNDCESRLSFSETHVWVKECQAEYQEKMKPAQFYTLEDELEKLHTEVLPIVLRSFQNKWSTKSGKVRDREPYEKMLKDSANEAYLQLRTVFSLEGSIEGKEPIKEEKEIPSC